jgi:hypothetical protein
LLLRRLAVVLLPLSLLALVACAPARPDRDAGSVGDRRGPIDFLKFVQDRPAVGGDWYQYNEEAGHVLTPFEHVYVTRTAGCGDACYAALRVVTYYDSQTAESGRFTLRYRTWDGAWSDESEWVSSKNIKSEGPVCFDFVATNEVDCALGGWQVQLRAYSFLAREGPIVVNRPGLFVHSFDGFPNAGDVRVATLVDRSTLDALPDPTGIVELDDRPPSTWTSTAWDLTAFAPNLPQAGMILGDRAFGEGFVATGDALLLENAQRRLSRFVIAPVTEGAVDDGVVVTHAGLDLDLADNTVAREWPDAQDVTVDAPALGEMTLLSFEEAELVVTPDAEATLPHVPPRESGWDLALVRVTADHLRVVLSPGSALYNATQIDQVTSLEDAHPPLE